MNELLLQRSSADAPYLAGNFEPCEFKIGDLVLDNTFGEAKVIGLPSKGAPGAAPRTGTREGVRGTVWIKVDKTAQRIWRGRDHLKLSGSGSSPRKSPRLEQAALASQRAKAKSGTSSARRTLNVDLSDKDEEDLSDDQATTDEEPAPELAAHERNRKRKKKPKIKGAFHSTGTKTKGTKVPLSQRLSEFPDCSLTISDNKLFCVACKWPLPNLKNTIDTHVSCASHKKRVAAFMKGRKADDKLSDEFSKYFTAHPEERGTHVPTNSHIVSYRTTEAFLASGTPLERVPYFKDLIEKGSATLRQSSDLAACYIPMIEAEQVNLLKDELRWEYIGIQFDGTTRLGEAVVCVARYCDESFELQRRAIMCKTTARHVNGRELAVMITELLCTTLKIFPSNVVGVTRDSASVNGKACRRLAQNPFSNLQQMLCIAHTLNNVGSHVKFDILDNWITPWLELVGGRNPHRGAQALWKEAVAPTIVPGFSKTRWHSKAEIQFVMAEHFDKLPDFLDELDEVEYGNAARKSLREIYQSHHQRLQLQLATILDLRPIVKETYDLEGDRLEILLVYRRIEALRRWGESIRHYDDGCLANVQAVLRAEAEIKNGLEIVKDFPPHGAFSGFVISSSKVQSTLYPGKEVIAYKVRYPSDGAREDLEEDELRPLIKTCHMDAFKEMCDTASQAFDYLDSRITGTCQDVFSCEDMYEACRLFQAFDPTYACNITNAWINDLYKINLFGDLNKIKLKSSLPKYQALASEWTVDHNSVDTFSKQVLKFWRSAKADIPEWAGAARAVFAISPNSAAAERVFSLLDSLFGEERDASLADMIQASIFLRYNNRVVGSKNA